MEAIVYLLGTALIVYCIYSNLYTRQSVAAPQKMYRTYQLKYLAVFPAVVSVLRLISAPALTCPWPLWIIGIAAAIEAIVAFLKPKHIYSRTFEWFFENGSNRTYQFFSIIGIIFGTLIMTMVK
jgi:hypothetical protein